jgi:hypothetical protein
VIFNQYLQLDATWGEGLWGGTVLPVWVSSGIRVVSNPLF